MYRNSGVEWKMNEKIYIQKTTKKRKRKKGRTNVLMNLLPLWKANIYLWFPYNQKSKWTEKNRSKNFTICSDLKLFNFHESRKLKEKPQHMFVNFFNAVFGWIDMGFIVDELDVIKLVKNHLQQFKLIACEQISSDDCRFFPQIFLHTNDNGRSNLNRGLLIENNNKQIILRENISIFCCNFSTNPDQTTLLFYRWFCVFL